MHDNPTNLWPSGPQQKSNWTKLVISGFLRLFLIVLICLIFCYVVLIKVNVSVPSGAFLSLAGILLFFICVAGVVNVSAEINK